MTHNNKTDPASVSGEYFAGASYKAGLGRRGVNGQAEVNERFFIGDQWHGAQVGGDRPLVRRNIIRRIGEYKMSAIGASPVTVGYTAEGVPDGGGEEEKTRIRAALSRGEPMDGPLTAAEISVVMTALSDYFRTTAERVRFDVKREQLLRDAYISGTGLCYTYWDEGLETGLFADDAHTKPVRGDVAFETVDIESVVFGDPCNDSVEEQPYITVAVRRQVDEVRRQALRYGADQAAIDLIRPDGPDSRVSAGEYGRKEPEESGRVTLYTKFYKEYDGAGLPEVFCVQTTAAVTVRPAHSIGLRRYPFAKFCWERRKSCAYGESEITHMIPNQIAINRALTAEVWAMMTAGMPITVINGDVVPDGLTNNPGQVVKVFGSGEDVRTAVRYVEPPSFGDAMQRTVAALAADTLSDAGANDAALGNLRPDNAAAIIQVREAAMAPLQVYMNRWYGFCEDIARIWAEFWLTHYGRRRLLIGGKQGVLLDAARYRGLLISARVDVGASTLRGEAVVIETLDRLLDKGYITFAQYLDRLPAGLIPDVTGLRREVAEAPAEKEEETE